MNRKELLIEMQERIDRGESAEVILGWLDSIGYEPEAEPGYQEAAMAAVADTVATFYLSLTNRNLPPEVALQLTQAFMYNAQSKAS